LSKTQQDSEGPYKRRVHKTRGVAIFLIDRNVYHSATGGTQRRKEEEGQGRLSAAIGHVKKKIRIQKMRVQIWEDEAKEVDLRGANLRRNKERPIGRGGA